MLSDACLVFSLLISLYYLYDTKKLYFKCTDPSLQNFIHPYFFIVFLTPLVFIIFLVGSAITFDIPFLAASLLYVLMALLLLILAGNLHSFSKESKFIDLKEQPKKKLSIVPTAIFLFLILLAVLLFPRFATEIDLLTVLLSFVSFSAVFLAALSEPKLFSRKIWISLALALFLSLITSLTLRGALVCPGQASKIATTLFHFFIYPLIFFAIYVFVSEFSKGSLKESCVSKMFIAVSLLFSLIIPFINGPDSLSETAKFYFLFADISIILVLYFIRHLFKEKHWLIFFSGLLLLSFFDMMGLFSSIPQIVPDVAYMLSQLAFAYAAYAQIKARKRFVVYEHRFLCIAIAAISLFVLCFCTLFPRLNVNFYPSRMWEISAAITSSAISLMLPAIFWLSIVSFKLNNGQLKRFVYALITSFSLLFIFYALWLVGKFFSLPTTYDFLIPLALIVGIYGNQQLKKLF